MKVFRVIGNPISQSLSPQIHAEFARQLNLTLDYQAELLPKEGFISGIQRLLSQGVNGFSITLPFKQEACRLAEVLTPRAQKASSVNTLWVHPGDQKLHGDNTDGAGLIQDLSRNQQLDLHHKQVLVVGSGGAALGIIWPLLDAGAWVTVMSRRVLDDLHPLKGFSHERLTLSVLSEKSEGGNGFDLIINATPVGLKDSQENFEITWPRSWVGNYSFAYDLGYSKNNQPTCFMRWALDQGAEKAADGFGMLLEQAALQFEIFMGVRPKISEELWGLRKD